MPPRSAPHPDPAAAEWAAGLALLRAHPLFTPFLGYASGLRVTRDEEQTLCPPGGWAVVTDQASSTPTRAAAPAPSWRSTTPPQTLPA